MSMIKDFSTAAVKTPSTTRRSSCFLGCFGFSGGNKTNEAKPYSRRWWKSRIKRSTAKTAAVDHIVVSGKFKFPTPPEIQVVGTDPSLTKKPLIMVCKSCTKSNSRGRAAVITPPPQPPAIENRRGSQEIMLSQSVVSSPLTRSVSLPPPKGKKGPSVGGGGSGQAAASGGDFDSVIGMSIILVILVMMLLWGKLCAIVCTCAWLFIAPRVSAAVGYSGGGPTAVDGQAVSGKELDLDSVEYKKKVVLEGLLQRNNRTGSVS